MASCLHALETRLTTPLGNWYRPGHHTSQPGCHLWWPGAIYHRPRQKTAAVLGQLQVLQGRSGHEVIQMQQCASI